MKIDRRRLRTRKEWVELLGVDGELFDLGKASRIFTQGDKNYPWRRSYIVYRLRAEEGLRTVEEVREALSGIAAEVAARIVLE